MTEAAVKKAAQRLRGRYREVLRERIAETVEDPGQVEDEIRELFAALGALRSGGRIVSPRPPRCFSH